ncbi:hypothetical protein LTR66_014664, partial [Elasticomyces elasticus]
MVFPVDSMPSSYYEERNAATAAAAEAKKATMQPPPPQAPQQSVHKHQTLQALSRPGLQHSHTHRPSSLSAALRPPIARNPSSHSNLFGLSIAFTKPVQNEQSIKSEPPSPKRQPDKAGWENRPKPTDADI